MQKLVKRKMHYQAIVPIEAYHTEDDPLMEEGEFWGMGMLIVQAGIVGTALGGPVGGVLASKGVRAANHYFDLWDNMVEGEAERQRLQQVNDEALRQGMVNIGEAIVDGVTTVLDAIDDANGNEPVSSKREGGG